MFVAAADLSMLLCTPSRLPPGRGAPATGSAAIRTISDRWSLRRSLGRVHTSMLGVSAHDKRHRRR